MQMPMMIENDLNQKSKLPGKTPHKQLKLRNLKTGFEIDWNSILPEFGENARKNDTILAKYDLRPISKNVKIGKMKNTRI